MYIVIVDKCIYPPIVPFKVTSQIQKSSETHNPLLENALSFLLRYKHHPSLLNKQYIRPHLETLIIINHPHTPHTKIVLKSSSSISFPLVTTPQLR